MHGSSLLHNKHKAVLLNVGRAAVGLLYSQTIVLIYLDNSL